MTLLKLIDNCRRLQSAMDMSSLDLDPVIHLSYEEADAIFQDAWRYWDLSGHPPVPGTFWYMCFGIRTFVERIDS